MKSFLPNNFMNPGAADQSSSVIKDLGISSRSLGKKDSVRSGNPGFTDFLMQAMQQEQSGLSSLPKTQLGAPVAPSPTISKPQTPVADRQVAGRLERDLSEKRNAQPLDRSPRPAADRDEVKNSGADKDKLKASNDKNTNTDLTANKRPANIERDRSDTPPATAAVGSAARDLRPLKMAVGNKASAENMAGNNAVLSFVTGRLDRLDPEGIPGIIVGNPFLKEAAASSEIMDLMLQPMPIADLCKLFEIDQSIISKAVANGLDSAAIVTPKEFLAAIGVDPGRVTSELQMMQQKLPLEGVQSYVERAKAMAQNISNKKPMLAEEITIDVVSPLDAQGVEAAIANSSRIEEEKSGRRTPEPTPNVGMNVPTMPTVAVGPGQQNINKPSPAGITKVDTRAKASPDDLIESLIAGRAMSTQTPGLSELNNNVMKIDNSGLNLNELSLSKDQIPMSKEDSLLDPYAMLGQDMSSFSSETFNYAPVTVGMSMANLEEQMAANGFALKQNLMGSPNLNQTQNIASESVVKDRNVLSIDELLSAKDFDSDKPLDMIGIQESPSHISTNSAQNITEGLTLAVEGLTRDSGSNQSFQDSMSGGGEQKDSRSSSENLSALATGGVIGQSDMKQASGFGTIMETAASSATNEPSTNLSGLHNKIMQHATMMLKDGGGTMRMNVDAPGMGKIDLAINLVNNQLDVRILTPNDQVRDIINKELSGLRDGLGQQGISLRAVEVGNASQSSNQFAGGQFGQGHNGQQATYNEMKEYAKSFAGSFPSRESSNTRMSVNDVRSNIPSSWINSARDVSKISVRI